MTNLTTPSKAIVMRDALRDWLEDTLRSDSRIVFSHDTERISADIADDLIRDGWVVATPEEPSNV